MTEPSGSSEYNGRIFDRVEKRDPRNHMLAAALVSDGLPHSGRELARLVPASKSRKRTVWLDQGSEGACTGFSSAQAMSISPIQCAQVTNNTGTQLYRWAQANDEWPGEAYSGSSLLGAMQGLFTNGFITQYDWITDTAQLAYALAFTGPVVLGCNWYSSFMHPNEAGDISLAGGAIVGGHAIMVNGYKTHPNGVRLFTLANSWGKTWGNNGDCYISESDLQYLLSNGGDAVTFKKADKVKLSSLPV